MQGVNTMKWRWEMERKREKPELISNNTRPDKKAFRDSFDPFLKNISWTEPTKFRLLSRLLQRNYVAILKTVTNIWKFAN